MGWRHLTKAAFASNSIALFPGPHQRATLSILQQVRKQVGMVFQQFNLFPHLNVLENVIEAPLQVLGQSKDAAIATAVQLLERVGLAEKQKARPDQLSGGQQQRVAIARTLAMQTQVILFDEPTSALDPRMTGEVLAVMRDLASEGQTMIVVTHAMGFARRVANKVHVFQGGYVLESGPPEQIFDHPQQADTAAFVHEAAED